MKTKIMPRIIVLLIGAALLSALGMGCVRKPEPEPEPVEEIVEEIIPEEEMAEEVEEVVEEEPPPPPPPKVSDFTAVLLNGRTLSLSQTEARVLVLNFWLAVGSPESKKQITELKKLYSRYREQGVEIVGISLDQGRDSEVRTFIREKGVTYPVCIDSGYRIFDRYQPGQFPATFVVAEDLTLVKKFAGPVSMEELEAEISPLLGGE